jgi:hypothetical protein
MKTTTSLLFRRVTKYTKAVAAWEAPGEVIHRGFSMPGDSPPAMEDRILTMLGCPHMDSYGPLNDEEIIAPEVPENSKDEVKVLLPKLIAATVLHLPKNGHAVASLLAGVKGSSGLAVCLSQEKTTYALAAALFYFCGTYSETWPLDQAVKGTICTLLNRWVRPPIPWAEPPAVADLAAALFGQAWGHFNLIENLDVEDTVRSEAIAGSLARMIMRDRPPFVSAMRVLPEKSAGLQLPASLGGDE